MVLVFERRRSPGFSPTYRTLGSDDLSSGWPDRACGAASWFREPKRSIAQIRLRFARDHRDGPTAVRTLMLGAARDIEIGEAEGACEHATDQSAGMAGGIDVAIVEHDMALAADAAVARGLGLGEYRAHAATRFGIELASGREVECTQHLVNRRQVDRVFHHTVRDCRVAGPGGAVAEHDDLATGELDSGRGAGAARPKRKIGADRLIRD